MIINYNPINGSGPLRIIFDNTDLLKISAIEAKEETGVYWIDQNQKLLAVEFDEISSSGEKTTLTIKETGQVFSVTVNKNGISIDSPSLSLMAG
jgi:hypothetical protein